MQSIIVSKLRDQPRKYLYAPLGRRFGSNKHYQRELLKVKNGEPDFSPFAKEQVYIPNMGERKGGADVPTDFTQQDRR